MSNLADCQKYLNQRNKAWIYLLLWSKPFSKPVSTRTAVCQNIFYLAKHSKSALPVPAQEAIISPAQRNGIHRCWERGMLMNQTGENVCMRTRNTFALYLY